MTFFSRGTFNCDIWDTEPIHSSSEDGLSISARPVFTSSVEHGP